MHEQSSSEELRQLAAESILEASSLTDGLTDDEAEPLVSWGLGQALVAADAAVAVQGGAVGGLVASLPDDDLGATVAGHLSPVRRIMKAISQLTADRHELSAQQVVGELVGIRTLAVDLPDPPGLEITDTTLAELAGWQPIFDNMTFVRAILVLLDPEPRKRGSSVD